MRKDWARFVVGALVACLVPAGGAAARAAGPYQATGFKVGEMSATSAIVWTRLTARPEANPADGPMVELVRADQTTGDKAARKRHPVVGVRYPPGLTVADIRSAVPGTEGEVRVGYRAGGDPHWLSTGWKAVDPRADFTRQFPLDGLKPDCRYRLKVESRGRGGAAGQTLEGGFRTAPAPDHPAGVVFTVSTGQAFGDQDDPGGFRIYRQMLKLDPSFFVHTGDIVYYDKLAKTLELARYHWQRTYSLPNNVRFHRRVGSYFIKDDHDTWQNDCWPTMQNDRMFQFTFAQGAAVFKQQVPMGRLTYRTRRWGKDLQIWLVEGRDYRSPNTAPDGPGKTIWGAAQKAWFQRTVAASDATFRLLISPPPLVGPDRDNKRDNHSTQGFTHEGNALREFIGRQKNMAVVCGDRHWQYHSVDPVTGLREYCCGAASDRHAGGWKQDDFRPRYHRYLNVVGGFLSGTLRRIDGVPTLTFRFHGTDGQVLFEDQMVAQ